MHIDLVNVIHNEGVSWNIVIPQIRHFDRITKFVKWIKKDVYF